MYRILIINGYSEILVVFPPGIKYNVSSWNFVSLLAVHCLNVMRQYLHPKGVYTVKRMILGVLLMMISIILCPHSSLAADPTAPVVVVQITGEIDASQAAMLHRAMTDAGKMHAQAVVIEMDTFGGFEDSAVKMRDVLLDSPVNTICYINHRAWSAGALITLACQHIVMSPGSSIGAAEPISTTEKTVAAMKAEFAATANKRARNVQVAEAMVDKSLGYAGYAKPGEILALADYQAITVGYAEASVSSRDEVLQRYNLGAAKLVEYTPIWSDKLLAVLASPWAKFLLVSLLFLSIMVEIKTAGMGVGAVAGLVVASVFFAVHWFTDDAGWMAMALFVAGVLLLMLELYIPGFGFVGVTGIVCILGGIFLGLGGTGTALYIMMGSLVCAVLVFALLLKWLPSSRLWNRLILKTAETTQAGFVSGSNYEQFIGKEGAAITPLRPAGTVVIDEVRLDAMSEGQFIPLGARVKVVKVAGSMVVVTTQNKI